MADQPTARETLHHIAESYWEMADHSRPAEQAERLLSTYDTERRDQALTEAAQLLYAVDYDEHNISLCCRDCAMESAAAVLLAARTTPTT